MILLQVRGNGTVFYPSSIEPWAYELTGSDPSTTGKDPGWDPLAVAIKEAHKRNIQLHAYMNTYPGWRGTTYPPADSNQLWWAHQDWFCRDSGGNIMIPTGWWSTWYSFLSPGHPDVQAYLHSVHMEVLQRYPDIDGLHYDYCRYPGEVGDWSWNATDVSICTAEAGGTPTEKPTEWNNWRRAQITKFVRNAYTDGEKIVPFKMYSCAVAGGYSEGYNTNFQAAHDWLSEGIIDCIMPMTYTTSYSSFTMNVQNHVSAKNGRFVAPGIGASVSGFSVEDLYKEITIARDLGADGVTVFSYSSLFPGNVPNNLAKALITGPFSNIAKIPRMRWKIPSSENIWTLH